MTAKSLKVYVGEGASPVQDLTDYVNWEASRFMSMAYNGESSVSSIVFRDEDSEMGPWTDTTFTLAARNQVEVKLGTAFIWRGRLIGRSWQRGIQKADTAREVIAEAEDVNADLNLIMVDQWERPAETVAARIAALGSTYLNGSPRATTVIDVATWVAADATALAAKTYTRTTPMGVMQDIIGQTHRVFWITLDKKLFYDDWDSTAYDSGLRITESHTELAADPTDTLAIIPDSGPLFAINGQRFISAVRVYYGSGPTDYVDASDPAMEAVKAHAAEVVYAPESVSTAAEAELLAAGLLAERSQDGRTFTLSVRNANGGSLTEAQVALIQPGRLITIKSHVLPLASYSDYPTRIVSVQWHMPRPDTFYATLKLEKPEKAYGVGTKPGPRPPPPDTGVGVNIAPTAAWIAHFLGVGSDIAQNVADGDVGTSAFTGIIYASWFRADFGAPVSVYGYRLNQSPNVSGNMAAGVTVDWSDDGTAFTTLYTSPSLSLDSGGVDFGTSASHRYWRVATTGASPTNVNGWLVNEIELYDGPLTVATTQPVGPTGSGTPGPDTGIYANDRHIHEHAHLTTGGPYHLAEDVNFTPGIILATNVQEALEEVAGGATGELLISDAAGSPLVFGDILQNETETDFMYGD